MSRPQLVVKANNSSVEFIDKIKLRIPQNQFFFEENNSLEITTNGRMSHLFVADISASLSNGESFSSLCTRTFHLENEINQFGDTIFNLNGKVDSFIKLIPRDNEIETLESKINLQSETIDSKTESLQDKIYDLQTKNEELSVKVFELENKAEGQEMRFDLLSNHVTDHIDYSEIYNTDVDDRFNSLKNQMADMKKDLLMRVDEQSETICALMELTNKLIDQNLKSRIVLVEKELSEFKDESVKEFSKVDLLEEKFDAEIKHLQESVSKSVLYFGDEE